ncbi:MAG: cytochrome C oxidase subunit IV family protein [Rhodocyclaceae bacterium]|nr:cytochrome C oxidase subunit IV family protein [Rhodocyclaceae bacterium]MBX3668671.1 cytochrome C oxidase subunit IV family protein [Rhodocyclaceae bacterium]
MSADKSFALLLAATAATFLIGETGAAGGGALAGLLILMFAKGRLVVLDFMGLRAVRGYWRLLLPGWLLLVALLIAIAFRAAQSN